MAIPGMKPHFEVRAKVRIGIKKKSKEGKEYPSAVDYFVCDDPEFQKLYPGKPKMLRIMFAAPGPTDAFPTGLEMWKGKMLACYTKGETSTTEGNPTVAYRRNSFKQGSKVIDLLAGESVIGEPMGMGKERTPIACRFRSCPYFLSKECKPMGRLQFFLEGGPTDGVFQIDTKAWNSIELLEGALSTASVSGDLRGRVFELSVTIEQRGTQKFPVLHLKEADVIVKNDSDLELADVMVNLRIALEQQDDFDLRLALVDALELTNPGWRGNEKFVARIKEIGVEEAARGLLSKVEL
jgi:hypothetical protein